MPERKPYTFDRVVRLLLGVAAIVGVYYLLDLLKGALLPFLVAWLIAYLLNPLVVRNQKFLKVKGRVLPIILSFVEIAIFISLLVILVLPSVVNEIKTMRELLYNYVYTGAGVPFMPQAVHEFISKHVDFTEFARLLSQEQWKSLLEGTLSQAWGFISGSVQEIVGFISWFIVLLYIFFILLDYDKILTGFQQLIPRRYRRSVMKVVGDIEFSMNRYFRGQALVATCVGILFSIGFLIIGLPLAIVLGLFIGLLNMVPYLQVVGLVPTVILCLVSTSESGDNFWVLFGLCMVVFAVVQIIQDAVLTPRIMGKVTGLNPAIILLSLSIWGTLLGVIGMIIALPMTTLILAYYQKYIIERYDETQKKKPLPTENQPE